MEWQLGSCSGSISCSCIGVLSSPMLLGNSLSVHLSILGGHRSAYLSAAGASESREGHGADAGFCRSSHSICLPAEGVGAGVLDRGRYGGSSSTLLGSYYRLHQGCDREQ